jgi:hypothetical protein
VCESFHGIAKVNGRRPRWLRSTTNPLRQIYIANRGSSRHALPPVAGVYRPTNAHDITRSMSRVHLRHETRQSAKKGNG